MAQSAPSIQKKLLLAWLPCLRVGNSYLKPASTCLEGLYNSSGLSHIVIRDMAFGRWNHLIRLCISEDFYSATSPALVAAYF